jgi:hypothetical protein
MCDEKLIFEEQEKQRFNISVLRNKGFGFAAVIKARGNTL